MAKRKAKIKRKSISFRLGKSKKTKKHSIAYIPSFSSIIKLLAVFCVLAVIGVGFIFLEKYVKQAVPVSQRSGSLELVDVPGWVNEPLMEKVYAAAGSGGQIKLNEDTARLVQQNIEAMVAWLDEVRVQTTHDSICISGKWRRPLALISSKGRDFYVDAELVVLDFVPLPTLPIVQVKGLSTKTTPQPGQPWQCDDLAAAVAVLVRLDRMDKLVTPDKPLLYEIDAIDVSNFQGRRRSRKPHIVLYAKDDTKIIWGAEIGTWQRYLEATDEEKLAKLYEHYTEFGSLLNSAKYINLCDPQGTISQPVDKY